MLRFREVTSWTELVVALTRDVQGQVEQGHAADTAPEGASGHVDDGGSGRNVGAGKENLHQRQDRTIVTL
jgi:hypothetical protein